MRTITAQAYDDLLLTRRPLLDLRAPVEFARGAVPGAASLPLMTDEERAQVGARYKAEGQDAAVALGHALVSGSVRRQRLEAWCAWADAHPDGAMYCFRGGLRSQTAQAWLAETGRELPLVEGGYKALRRHLIDRLERCTRALRPIVIGGRTGTAKTTLIERVPRSVDLEGLANHRGSAFGRRVGGQPTPVDFENALALRLMRLAQQGDQPIAVEDESRNVGRLSVPPSLLERMGSAPIALVEMPLAFRVDVTLNAYIIGACDEHIAAYGVTDGFARFADQLRDSLTRIRKRLGGQRHDEVSKQLEVALAQHRRDGDTDAHRIWIERLLVEYYDPMYDYQLEKKLDRVAFRGTLEAVHDWVTEHTRASVNGDRERP